MGRKGPRAKTKTVLKSVNKWEQFGSMQNLKFLNKNPPTITVMSQLGCQGSKVQIQNPVWYWLNDSW